MFVFVPSSLANALERNGQLESCERFDNKSHTDFVIGDLAKVVDWKLKTPLPSSDILLRLPALLGTLILYRELASNVMRGVGWAE